MTQSTLSQNRQNAPYDPKLAQILQMYDQERFQATEEFRDALEIWTTDDFPEFNPNPNYPWTPMDIFPNTEKYRKMFYDFVMKWWVQQSEEKNELFQN